MSKPFVAAWKKEIAMSTLAHSQPHTDTGPEDVLDVHETNCCVVGGGPAGVMLSLLLMTND